MSGSGDRKEPLIGVIDAGTRTIKFCVFKAKHTKELFEHAVDINPIIPQEGWHEQDPVEILNAIKTCISEVTKQCNIEDIATIGVTNQRETVVVWDPHSGEPLYNAIGKFYVILSDFIVSCYFADKKCDNLTLHFYSLE